MALRLVVAFWTLLFLVAASAASAAERRIALVIGNDKYQSVPALNKAVNDAKAVAETLREVKFDTVIEITDADRKAMDGKVREFVRNIREGDTAFFFYAGHGVGVGSANYLLPTDFPQMTEDDDERTIADEARSIDSIMASIQERNPGRLFMILDACRNNPLPKPKGRSIGRSAGLVNEAPVTGVFMLFSAGFGQEALDALSETDQERNSVFTRNLLPLLREKGISQVDLAKKLQTEVKTLAASVNHSQNPAYYDQIDGLYYLNGAPDATPPVVQDAKTTDNTTTDNMGSAASDWLMIKDTKDATLLQAFKQKYSGDPLYKAMAESQLALLVHPEKPVSTRADDVSVPETECDRLAARPDDPMKPKTVAGVSLISNIDGKAAVDACQKALVSYPDNPRLLFELGRALIKEQRYAEALASFHKAAGVRYAAPMNAIGYLYFNGMGVSRDNAEAMRWFRKAADLGDVGAMLNIGGAFAGGQSVTQDYAEAMRWYRKAADLGNPFAMTSIGLMYGVGNGVTRDNAEAIRWFYKAADLGDAEAMTNIGVQFDNGQGVTQDYAEAMRWYRKAADRGNAVAMRNIGLLFDNGRGLTQDYAEAMRWFRKAADLGNAGAMVNIGVRFDNGQGVAQDHSEAMRWYHKGADLGDARAMYNIGINYGFGKGVTQNPEQAASWLFKALRAGDDLTLPALQNTKLVALAETRRLLQAKLKKSGYYDGPIDGKFGKGTLDALNKALRPGEADIFAGSK